MVAPGFLQNPEVRRWLNGVEPAWTLLEYGSYAALHQEPLPGNQAIRLEPNLTEKDLAGSAVTRTARILLQHAADTGGPKLTATGNLSRAVIAEMIEVVDRLAARNMLEKDRAKLRALLYRLGVHRAVSGLAKPA